MANSIIKPCVVLLLISAIAAALLGYVNEITKEPIAEQNAKIAAEAMKNVLPDAVSFDEAVKVSDTDTVRSYNTARDGSGNIVGYAVTAASKGYGGDVVVMVGLKSDGTINAIDVTDNSNETPGLGANSSNPDFKSQYDGKTADLQLKVVKTEPSNSDEIQAITSATITSNSVTNSVNAVLTFYNNTLANAEISNQTNEIELNTEILTETETEIDIETTSESAEIETMPYISESEEAEVETMPYISETDEEPVTYINDANPDTWQSEYIQEDPNSWDNNEFEGGNY